MDELNETEQSQYLLEMRRGQQLAKKNVCFLCAGSERSKNIGIITIDTVKYIIN